IDVDETGTEAAAVTSISMVFTSVSTPQNQAIPFVANRPFVYLIRERSSGTILFIGKMENPVL
ncbi:MAG TPA: serpin family protein, partial [Balneolales bacterium]|nr:serpin family protein [Balneolales bacterium]